MADWIAPVEAAYELAGRHDEWLRGLLENSAPLLDSGVGMVAYTYTISATSFQIEDLVARSDNPALGQLARAILERIDPPGLVRLHASPPEAGTLSRKILRDHPEHRATLAIPSGGSILDAFALLAPTATGRGVALSAPMGTPRSPTRAERTHFGRLAAHIGSGFRLRCALGSLAASATPDAVLDGGGKLLDASAPACCPHAQESLRDAVRRRERARTREQRSNPESALGLWEGLVSGRWSLVDQFERDGKRFVVAHPNEPELGDPRGLTRRERQIAEYLGMGRSSKEISYLLGISLSAVSNAAARAARKLGLSSRAELASFFAPGGLRARLAELELAGVKLAAGAAPLLGEERLALLSEAERDVVLDLLRGATLAAIALRRGSSPLTVETQVKSIYAKLGVGSRVELGAALSAP